MRLAAVRPGAVRFAAPLPAALRSAAARLTAPPLATLWPATLRPRNRLPERRWALRRATADIAQAAGFSGLLTEVPAQEYGATLGGVGILREAIEAPAILRAQRDEPAGQTARLLLEFRHRDGDADAFITNR